VAAPLSDEQLLRLMLSGDAQAFEVLYDRRQGGVYRYALRMTGSESMAEDVTQDIFLALISDSQQFDASRGAFKSYLYGMARHRILRRLERERILVSIDSRQDEGDGSMDNHLTSSEDPFTDLARDEIIGLVRQAILSLPAHSREVIVLCHLQEMKYTEVAEVLACPIGTVRSRLNRARTLLVDKLKLLQESGIAEQTSRSGQAI
jgi:RNA polymerase sigma-70 factor (ECF subfamily)